MELEISTESLGTRRSMICARGRLNAISAGEVKSRIRELVDERRVELVFDLSGITFLDSSGLAALVFGLKAAREAGGWLKLAGLGDQSATVFRLTQLDRVFELYPDAQAALRAADGTVP